MPQCGDVVRLTLESGVQVNALAFGVFDKGAAGPSLDLVSVGPYVSPETGRSFVVSRYAIRHKADAEPGDLFWCEA